MRNPIQKFVFEKPGILSEKLKTLSSSNYHRVEYFLLKLRTRLLPWKYNTNRNNMYENPLLYARPGCRWFIVKKAKIFWSYVKQF